MTVVLCDAVSFGFGPVGKLLAVLAYLDAPAEVVFIGSGSSAELIAGHASRIIEADTESPAALQPLRGLFEDAAVFVNVMNPVSLRFAHDSGVRSLVIDSLFWMWDRIDPAMAAAGCYCIQNFVGVEQRLARDGHLLRNPRLVGPIVDATRPRPQPARSQLLINLGGLTSAQIQHGRNLSYPAAMAAIFERALRDHGYDRVLFTGGAAAMRDLARALSIPRAEYACVAHREFLTELAGSSLVVTSPGLTTAYEAVLLDVPLAFLPPQNYSQYHNLRLLRDAGVAQRSIHWSDLFADPPLGSGMAEDAGVAAVLGLIERFRSDRAAQTRVVDELAAMAAPDPGFAAEQVARQRAFRSGLGDNGAPQIAAMIRQLVEARPW